MKLINEILTINDLSQLNDLDQTNDIWFSIMKLDIISVFKSLESSLINPEIKQKFLEDLHIRFIKHKKIKDDEFYLRLVECPKIHKRQIICEFVGQSSGINLGLYFQYSNNKVSNITFCNCLGGIEDLK